MKTAAAPRACIPLVLLWAALACPAHADTLPEAVARALSTFPDVRSSAANRRAVSEALQQARAQRLPSLDAALGAGRESTDSPLTRATPDRTVTLGRSEAELTLSQLLFDGGATSSQVRRQQALSDSASQQYSGVAESVALRITQVYLDVLRLRQSIDIAASNVAAHQRTLDQVNLIVESGAGRRADSRQSEARLALAQSSLLGLRGQLDQSEADYRHLTGRVPGPLVPPVSSESALPSSVRGAIDGALERNPAVRSAQLELEAAVADLEFSRDRMNPRVTVELGASHNSDLDGVRGFNGDAFAMLRLRQNLFRGGADNSRVREAQARRDEAMAKFDRQRNDVERDVRQAWEGLAAERLRLPQLQLHSSAAAEVVDAYRAQFKIGQRSLIDVLNAENEYFTARSNEVGGLYAVAAAVYKLLAATGRLLDGLGVAPPDSMELGAVREAQQDAPVQGEPQ
jgi:adhesin transport system outer membrane protein